jgi:hypothetical protein
VRIDLLPETVFCVEIRYRRLLRSLRRFHKNIGFVFGRAGKTDQKHREPRIFGLTVSQEVYGDINQGLKEIADAVSASTRVLQLYTDEQLLELVVDAHQHMFNHAELCIDFPSRSRAIAASPMISIRPKLDRNIAEMRRMSAKIIREVNYGHRSEMREASQKIAIMHFEQYEISRILHDQSTILQSMQQERVLLDSVLEQQKILQIVQTIQ